MAPSRAIQNTSMRSGRRETAASWDPLRATWSGVIEPMARHRTHSIEFKRQVAQEFLGGETVYALAKRHGLSRHLIRIWVAKFDAGDLDSDQGAAHLLADYEARIAALERLAGKLALENDFLKGALQHDRRPKSATTSVVAGPLVSPSQKDVD